LGHNTTGAVEGWHSSFKARNSLVKKRLLGRRPDWLVQVLVTEVDEHYAFLGRAKAMGASVLPLLPVAPPTPLQTTCSLTAAAPHRRRCQG
jgi:hypothetical protein